MAQELMDLGWGGVAQGSAPNLLVVNTCTVTGRADQQARQAVRRLAREFPGVPVWVTGCYAQRVPEEVAALPGVRLILGNREKAGLSRWLAALGRESRPLIAVDDLAEKGPFQAPLVRHFPGQTRARLKVQEGCSHQCSYCIVPLVRGPGRSLPPDKVMAACGELTDQGFQEVVLTGVDLGQYGRDLEPYQSLAGLLRNLSTRTWPFRLRLSSLEPQELSPALLRELAACPNLCPHFHLPLQSGAAPVLAAMHRPYTPEDFQERVLELHRLFPDAALGLDILVGFPGESAADFAATRDLVQALPVTYLHVFPFSPRPGTPAAGLHPLPSGEIRARAKIMRDLGRAKKQQFCQSQVGRVAEVLVEGPAPQAGWLQGLSANYLRVCLPGPSGCQNRIIRTRLRKIQGEMMVGGGDLGN
jgi:threonylcarbamoyladenosine tRNA methylthiotransferase MtaB